MGRAGLLLEYFRSSSQTSSCKPPNDIYEPLNHSAAEIRVISLLPGNFEDEIICVARKTSLNETSVDLNLRYEALSYTWGTSKESKSIHLDYKPLRVTINLFTALKYLRYASQSRYLWVDAICINQYDIQERNDQVQRMRDIYACASKVLIWLGESNPDLDNAFDFCTKYENHQKHQNNHMRKQNKKNTCDLNPEQDKVGVASVLRGMEKIRTNSWWTRVWVVQEFIVPKDDPIIGCGHKWMTWEAFRKVHLYIASAEEPPTLKPLMRTEAPELYQMDPFELFEFAKQRSSYQEIEGNDRFDLDSLLIRTANHEAYDPRDKVFALLSLVHELSTNLFADYHLNVTQVYQQAMIESFRACGDIELMLQAAGPKELKGLPSWCVDFSKLGWNSREYDWMKLYSFDHGLKNYNPGLRLERPPSHDLKSGEIVVAGKIIGNIAITISLEGKSSRENAPKPSSNHLRRLLSSQDPPAGGKWKAWMSSICGFSTTARRVLSSRIGREGGMQFFHSGEVWRLVAAGQRFENAIPYFYSVVPEYVHINLDYATIQKLLEKPKSFGSETVNAVKRWLWILYLTTKDCWLFTTENGYVGRAAYEVRNGDVLCLLYGCSRPVVLRKDKDGKFKFVTYTYTHDVKVRGSDSEDEVVGRFRNLNELDKEVTENIRKLETRELRLR